MKSRRGYGVWALAPVAAALCGAPCLLAQEPEPDGLITYTRDVAPVLFRQCAACHRPGGPAPFSVLRFSDVAPWAPAIAQATADRRMPPWLPDRSVAHYAGERWLSDPELSLIQHWVGSGAPEGDPADLPEPPAFAEGWQLGPPDLVVTLPAYQAPAGAGDRYRNLVAPVPVSEVRYVKAVEIRPGDLMAVHHARLMVDTSASSRDLDAADPEPGFDGMLLESAASHPGGFFVGWTPGRVATPGVDSLAWRLTPGTDLVLQVHVPAHTTAHTIVPQVGFHFAAGPPAKSPAVVMLETRDIDIPPGRQGYVVTDSLVLPVDLDVLGVYPHAHYLGKELEGFATLPGGRRRWLIRIKDWNFNWQDEYRFSDPLYLPRGSTITMRWRYDNTADNPRNPNKPPRRVLYGSRSEDEMANLVVQVLPRTAADREALERDLRWKYLADDADWAARKALRAGRELARNGQYAQAMERYREAVSHRPSADVHAAMAEALLALGQREAGLLHLREAVRLAENEGNRALAAELRRRLEGVR